jgi:alpha-beta hydrolase superfamily lysophospholipase
MENPAAPTDGADDDHIVYIDNPEGIKIPVRVYGGEEQGTPVLLMHGLQSHSGWFVQSASYIAGLGFPAYVIDRRGSGLSKAKQGECRDFLEMVKDMQTVSQYAGERHGKEKVHVLGHCFGAVPAAAFAAENPGRLASLILATPGIHTKSDLALMEKLSVLWSVITGAEVHIRVPLEPDMFSEMEEYIFFIRNDRLSLKAATGSFYFQVLRARNYIKKNIASLTMPVFMAFAGQDPICDNRRNGEMYELIPSVHKELKEYTDARHILEFSRQREDFFKDLKGWFKKFPGG